VKSVEEIYLGSFLQGLDDLLRRAGLDGEGAAPTRALLERTACPYQVDDLLDPPPEIPPREGEAPTRARIAAVAAAYIASDPPAEQSIRDAIRRLPWAYEVPDLAGALLRVLARRGDLTLPEPVPGREVVIVDSDTRAAGILWLRFVSEGTAVRVFADGASALDYLQQGGAGLVISEVDLPALSGLDLCAALRADPQTGRLKFFFVSREADPQVIMRGLSSGADDYLIKPVNVELLLIKAKRALAV
jgi:CheY-like chemotaxis protein